MNGLWAGMMLTAVVYGALHGTMPQVTQAAIDSSKEAVMLCITMLGILSFWMGLMEIGSEAGLIHGLTMKMRPFLHWLFPGIPEGHPAMDAISTNCIANVLGLGWAATPTETGICWPWRCGRSGRKAVSRRSAPCPRTCILWKS